MFFYYTVVHFPKDILSNDYKEKYKTGQLFCLGPDEEYDVWYGATIIAGIGDDYFDFPDKYISDLNKVHYYPESTAHPYSNISFLYFPGSKDVFLTFIESPFNHPTGFYFTIYGGETTS